MNLQDIREDLREKRDRLSATVAAFDVVAGYLEYLDPRNGTAEAPHRGPGRPPKVIEAAPAEKQIPAPESKPTRTFNGLLPDGFWPAAVTKAVASGATTPTAIWAAIKIASGLPEDKHPAFYEALNWTRKSGTVEQDSDGKYFIPGAPPVKRPAPPKSHHKRSPVAKKKPQPSFPWTSAIKEAIALGATTRADIWALIQKKHHLPNSRKLTFSVAMPYAVRHGHVIQDGNNYSLPAVANAEAVAVVEESAADRLSTNDSLELFSYADSL